MTGLKTVLCRNNCGAQQTRTYPRIRRKVHLPWARMERDEPKRLQAELDRLQNENHDLQIALLASKEHGVLLQEHLDRLSTSLTAEVRERHAAEEKLQKLIQSITREKGDLEILVQILIDQGDDSAQEGEKARIDGLTQIANRRRFDEYLLQEWGRHIRMQQPLSLLLCDVDHFKLYNDHHGHQAGDECLKSVAKALSPVLSRRRPGCPVRRRRVCHGAAANQPRGSSAGC